MISAWLGIASLANNFDFASGSGVGGPRQSLLERRGLLPHSSVPNSS